LLAEYVIINAAVFDLTTTRLTTTPDIISHSFSMYIIIVSSRLLLRVFCRIM